MDDDKIVELFWQRAESAIRETEKKYARYIKYIAYRILGNHEDAKECENDVYLKTWNSIPPNRPNVLPAFLAKITRNLALDKYDKLKAKKRGAGQVDIVLEELSDCIPDPDSVSDLADGFALSKAISEFLHTLPEQTCNVFVRKYWYMSTNREIASLYHISETNVGSILHRTRILLKDYLEKEGFTI